MNILVTHRAVDMTTYKMLGLLSRNESFRIYVAVPSEKEEMRLDVCSACHPFFTGQQKFINRGGRVEKFKKKFNLD